MITVSCDTDLERYIISVEGHANFGEKGQDTVCAAASILTYALYRAIQNFDTNGDISRFFHSISKGNAQFDFDVKEDGRERVKAAIDTVLEGFFLLEENYSGCVRVV